jgi:hypothetical protein
LKFNNQYDIFANSVYRYLNLYRNPTQLGIWG